MLQVVALAVAWVHGSIGIYFWLRLKPFFRRGAPVSADRGGAAADARAAGYYQSGRTVAALSALPEWSEAHLSRRQTGTREQLDRLAEIRDYTSRVGRVDRARVRGARRARVERAPPRADPNHYPDGKTIRVPRGLSVLESSWRFNIPARERLRRTRSLLDVPNPDHRRPFGAAAPSPRSGRCWSARDSGRIRRFGSRASCAAIRSRHRPAAASQCGHVASARDDARPGHGTARGEHVRRHARARRGSPSSGCRTTSCSSSIASSKRCRRR
jgi:hypothetical protein